MTTKTTHTFKLLVGILVVGILASFGFLLVANVANAQTTPPDFLFKWGTSGSGDGQFNQPDGIAFDSLGNVYVADFGNNRVQKFDGDGNFLLKWGSTRCILSTGSGCIDPDGAGPLVLGDGQFWGPLGIVVDDSDNVYVTDNNNNRIQKFDSSGNFLTKWGTKCIIGSGVDCIDPDGVGPLFLGDGQFYFPAGIALDDLGNIYIVDGENNRIQKFDSSGNFLIKWGTSGSGDTQFNYPAHIDLDSVGNVYVVDYKNHRIQKFDSNGNFLTKWGISGSGDGQLSWPWGIGIDVSDNVYIADYSNHRIQKFDSSGNFLIKWGTFGPGDGQFNGPADIAFDTSGNIYVTSYDNHRVQVFGTLPPLVGHWPFDEGFGQVAGDISGNGNDGTLGSTAGADSADPSWTSDAQVGANALFFDGIDDFVEVPDSPVFDVTDFSVSAWIKRPISATTGYQTVASHIDSIIPSGWFLGLSNNQLNTVCSFVTPTSPFCVVTTSGPLLNDDQWHHLALVRTAGVGVEYYVDGVNVATEINTDTSALMPNTNLFIGSFDLISIGRFIGNIDDVRIYNVALSAAEITTLYQEGAVTDTDNDGFTDDVDNCPNDYNPDQSDLDSQNGGDVCDICPNDATDTCDPNASTAEYCTTGSECTLSTPDGSVSITIPQGSMPGDQSISITDDSSGVTGFELTNNLGQVIGVFGVQFQPAGIVFDPPITVVFTWPDINNDGWVDGFTNPGIKEENLVITKDGVAITDKCKFDPGCDQAANTFTFQISSFSLVHLSGILDSDEDGWFDNYDLNGDGDLNDQFERDNCPTTPGFEEYQGCPVADKNNVTLHTVYLGGGSSSKVPLTGVEVRVFDLKDPDFQVIAGSENPSGSLYGVIFEADTGRVGACTTDANGECFAGEETVGYYLVIVKFEDNDTGSIVYVGRPKSPEDFEDTNDDGIVDLATKDFQIIKVFKKGVFKGYRGGSKILVTGSLLEVIVPESAIWEGTSSVYPFIFTSDSDWTVDVCAEVPKGYNIIGVYDDLGNLFTSTDCAQVLVAGEEKVIAFEVSEIGSPEPSFGFALTMKGPKGQVKKISKRVDDIRKSTFKKKMRKANRKAKRIIRRNSGDQLSSVSETQVAGGGDGSFWTSIKNWFSKLFGRG